MRENVIVTGGNIKILKPSANDINQKIITITINDIGCNKLTNSYYYNVSTEGMVIIPQGDSSIIENNKLTDINSLKSRIELIGLLESISFENISEDLSENELEKIYEYAKLKITRDAGWGKINPFSVEVTSERFIKVTLIIYNGNESDLNITKIPLKLREARDKVIFVGLVDVNENISSGKIGICQVKIYGEDLLEEDIDLSNWSITFEMK